MLNPDVRLSVYLQYYEKEINLTRIMKRALDDYLSKYEEPARDIAVYVKTEDGKAYYVVNHRIESYVMLWDSNDKEQDWELDTMEPLWKQGINRKLVFEYRGQQCDGDAIVERAIEKFVKIHTAKELKEVEIYVRQEDGAAYYVINGRYAGSVPMA